MMIAAEQVSAHNPRQSLVLLGAGGHAHVLLEMLQLLGDYTVVGLLDPNPDLHGTSVFGVPILGDDQQLTTLYQQGVRHAVVALGSVGVSTTRKRVYDQAQAAGFTLSTLVHPRASVASSCVFASGTVILNGAIVAGGTTLGVNVIVNTAAVIEHDSVVGDHVHIATRACLTGGVRVGDSAHIGANAVIRQGITVGEGAIVGAGAAVVRDVLPWTTVVGVPARPI